MLPTFVFLALLSVLWVSGLSLFVRASLTGRRKVAWTLLLVAIGAAIGFALPLRGIQDRFLLLVLLLPLLAIVDVKLASSNRSFLFWFRACSFEISTVFLTATLARLTLESW